MRSYLIGIAIVVALLVAALFATHTQAAVPPPKAHAKLAPPVPCTSKNRLDVFFDEDHIMWACECEMLMTMTSCRWQVIGGVDSPEARKFLRVHSKSIKWIIFKSNGKLTYYFAPLAFKLHLL